MGIKSPKPKQKCAHHIEQPKDAHAFYITPGSPFRYA